MISLHDLTESDLPLLLDYWFRSPPGFFEGLGVDWNKMPTEAEMEKNPREKIRNNQNREFSKLSVLAIHDGDQTIGMHTLNPIVENDHAVFHAHLFKSDVRRRGIAFYTYPRACKIFMERFNLKRILFKTPVQNTGAIRVKEKLGIRLIGEEEIGFSIIKEGTRAKVFEVTPSEIEKIIHNPHSSTAARNKS